jgi:hypothetical protein
MAKLQIAFLAANPATTDKLALDEEAHDIKERIRLAKYRDHVSFESHWAVRPHELLQILNDSDVDVLHFSGHGSRVDGICVVAKDGSAALIDGAALQKLFLAFPQVRLVFLNACHSGAQAAAICVVVDCVVGMSKSVGDDAARVFSSAFYGALAAGKSVRNAFDQAVAGLAVENLGYDGVPQLACKEGVEPDKLFLVANPP